MKRFAFAFCLVCLPVTLAGQEKPEAAPGLRVPGTSMPYALDSFDGKPELIPIQHSNVLVNNHAKANVAGELAGSFFYKPKAATELRGEEAAVTLHSRRPILYFHIDGDDDHNENLAGWAIVRAKADKDRRIVAQIRFTQLTGHGKHNDDIIDTKEAHLPNGWTTVTPSEDLANGQYVLTPIYKGNLFASTVYAFGIDPSAPEDELAIKPGATAEPLGQ
ncbi:MAG TPA: hypothetical protein VL346_13185 [Acidobacteriaceae bacterium]|jgi:hypothetical protein|nr:hypothetical protein [Acidobacteriaceae bacterium]